MDELADWARPLNVDFVAAAEARGFILGAALARELGAGFVPARKPGKLPHETIAAEYILEYGVDALEMHADALAHGTRVLLHDDLLATGGTAKALTELIEGTGAHVVGCCFLVELAFLGGRERLDGYDSPTTASDRHALADRGGCARSGVERRGEPEAPGALVAAGRARQERERRRLDDRDALLARARGARRLAARRAGARRAPRVGAGACRDAVRAAAERAARGGAAR